jgi:hypothetical protein
VHTGIDARLALLKRPNTPAFAAASPALQTSGALKSRSPRTLAASPVAAPDKQKPMSFEALVEAPPRASSRKQRKATARLFFGDLHGSEDAAAALEPDFPLLVPPTLLLTLRRFSDLIP